MNHTFKSMRRPPLVAWLGEALLDKQVYKRALCTSTAGVAGFPRERLITRDRDSTYSANGIAFDIDAYDTISGPAALMSQHVQACAFHFP